MTCSFLEIHTKNLWLILSRLKAAMQGTADLESGKLLGAGTGRRWTDRDVSVQLPADPE